MIFTINCIKNINDVIQNKNFRNIALRILKLYYKKINMRKLFEEDNNS